ncbi:MAG TPA: hypothetical protein VHG10_08490 [Glycomyces sp.]|nr:hypothetical protein [Glycomyces sp.]
MTDLSGFNDDELTAIMGAPRAVMEGAIVADGSTNPMSFMRELTAGAKVFKEAQRHENGFVKAVANRLSERGSVESGRDGLLETEDAITKALGTTERAIALLNERAEQQDREAYGDWLVRIATEVAESSRSRQGGFFSKKVAVTEAERAYIEELKVAVGR